MKTTINYLIKIWVSIFFLINSATPALAVPLSGDDSFIDELICCLPQDERPPKYFLKDWKKTYNPNNAFDASLQFQILENINLIKKLNQHKTLVTKNYVDAILNFITRRTNKNTVYKWTQTISTLLNRNESSVRIGNYIETFGQLIFKTNIAKNIHGSWLIDAEDFNFNYNEFCFDISKTNLLFIDNKDTITITQTVGKFCPTKKLWIGNGGVLELPNNSGKSITQKIKISSYQFCMNDEDLMIDSVQLTNKEIFDDSVYGKLTLYTTAKECNGHFPFFMSLDYLDIKNLRTNIEAKGYYYTCGSLIAIKGEANKRASLNISTITSGIVSASSHFFLISDKEISASKTSVIIPISSDSIYNNNVSFKFQFEKNMIFLLQNNNSLLKTPYYNTYHDLDINSTFVVLDCDNSQILFTSIPKSNRNISNFTSNKYFSSNEFGKMRGHDLTCPLIDLYKFSKTIQKSTFTSGEYAKFSTKREAYCHQQLICMANNGFINYDEHTKEATVRPKMQHWIRSRVNKVNYDLISFKAETTDNSPAAILNLADLKLTINGIDSMMVNVENLPDSIKHTNYISYEPGKTVGYLKPAEKRIVIKKDLNFSCDGSFRYNNYTYKGTKLEYERQTGYLNLDNTKLTSSLNNTNNNTEEAMADFEN